MRLALAVLLNVTVLVSSASAECAWVLWTRAEDSSGNRLWTTFASFPSMRQDNVDLGWGLCIKRLNEEVLPLIAKQPKGGWAVCLPDTVDPRAPKGP